MLIFDLKKCPEFISGDKAALRELLHPRRSSSLKIRYSLAHASVEPGQATQPHRLKTSEVYYVLKGRGIMHIDHECSAVHSGQVVYIPSGSTQFIENAGSSKLEFLCIVDPAGRPEDEEIL